jgi:hypothetical protein
MPLGGGSQRRLVPLYCRSLAGRSQVVDDLFEAIDTAVEYRDWFGPRRQTIVVQKSLSLRSGVLLEHRDCLVDPYLHAFGGTGRLPHPYDRGVLLLKLRLSRRIGAGCHPVTECLTESTLLFERSGGKMRWVQHLAPWVRLRWRGLTTRYLSLGEPIR